MIRNRKTFEYFLAKYQGRFLLYLDPCRFTFRELFPRTKINEIKLIVDDCTRKRKQRTIKVPLNERNVDPFRFLMDYFDEEGKGWVTRWVIVNGSLKLQSNWWYDLAIIADKEVVLKAIEKQIKGCKPAEAKVLNELPERLNTYFKISKDNTISKERMSAQRFLKYIADTERYESKAADIVDDFEQHPEHWT